MKVYHPPACPGLAEMGLVIALPFVRALQGAESGAQGVLQGPSSLPLQQKQSWCHRPPTTRAAAGRGGTCGLGERARPRWGWTSRGNAGLQTLSRSASSSPDGIWRLA